MGAWQLAKGRSRGCSASVRFLGRLAGWSILGVRFASWPHGPPLRVHEAGIRLSEGLPPLPGRNLLTRLSEPASRLRSQRGGRGLDPGWYILVALGLNVPAHVAELVRACWELGGRPSLVGLRLRKWAHMLGFGGHFSTKSRRYSTTLGALRRARVAYAIRRRRGDTLPLDAWGRPEDDQAVIVLASWAYLGSGYQSTGEAWLAASAAARAREERRIAKEELRTTPRAA
jgi:hypothetical protein